MFGKCMKLLIILLVACFLRSVGGAEPPQTIRVPDPQQGFLSVQKAIDMIAEGGTILIAKGIYDENLVIKKSLTLRGEGADPKEVRIVGVKSGYPVIRIESDSEIEVKIENLTAAEAKGDSCAGGGPPRWMCPNGVEALGKARVTMRDVHVSSSKGDGLWVWGSASVSLTNSTVSGECGWAILQVWDSASVTVSGSTVSCSGGWGLTVGGSASVTLVDSVVSGSGSLWAGDSAMATLTNSTVSDGLYVNESATATLTNSTLSDGLRVWDSATVSLTGSTISGDGDYGISVEDSAMVTLTNSAVSGNADDGLRVGGSAMVTLTKSTISGCERNGLLVEGSAKLKLQDSLISSNKANGIFFLQKAVAEIQGNRIIANEGYGVVIYWRGCVDSYSVDYKFDGQLTGGGNTIPGKDEPDGNKKGDVCPEWLAFLKQP